MKYTLMVSRNCGITYDPEFTTDNEDDPGLKKLIQKYELSHLRYYVKGDDMVTCSKHLVPIKLFNDGIVRTGGFKGNIEDKLARLRNKFCK